DNFWTGFAANPKAVAEIDRRRYTATYAQPGRMHAGFMYFAALEQDARDNQVLAKSKLTMPILAMGGEKSAGELVGGQFGQIGTNVKPMVIVGSGHWLLEEKPVEVMAAVVRFLNEHPDN
ncbi:MAG: alpha/beta hydrolase, partial [Paracoccaceae bacterium]